MMAQKLMSDNKDNPFNSRFFQPSDAYSKQQTRPIQGQLTLGNIASYFMPFSKDIGPYEDSPKLDRPGGVNIDFPPIVKDAVSGINKFGQVFRGELSQDEIKQLAFDTSLNVAGGGFLGSKIIPNAVPPGSLGIFAGKSAKTFPVVSQAQDQSKKVLQDQNRLMGEYQYVSNELTKGRMQLGDDVTEELTQRKNQLMDQMESNTSQIGKLDDEAIDTLEKRFASTSEKSFFMETDKEFGKGLFKLPDNKFRFEIDDRPANIKLNIGDDADALFSEITGDALERVLPRTDMGITKQLSEFLDHKELFAAYPQLSKYPVKIKFDTNDAARGSFRPRDKQITINLADMRPLMSGKSTTGKTLKKDIKSTLMHEVQHAIQEIEGFARGSNPNVANADAAVSQAVRQRQDILLTNQTGHNTYNAARADLVRLGAAERIKYYEQKSLLDSHQPRLLFNQSNWYRYGDDIRREVTKELGFAYNKRKSANREQWISRAFAKLAEKEREAMPMSARLADTLSFKEIKSQYGKASRITDKNYDSFADYRNARFSLEQIQDSNRYAKGNAFRDYNIYRDSLGEVEARAIQARVEPAKTNPYDRSFFPPDQFQEGNMDNAPPFGLRNTLRQEGGFFKD